MSSTKLKDKIGKYAFAAAAIVAIISVVAIFAFLVVKSVPALNKIGFFNFLFGDVWQPDKDATYADETLRGYYGIFKMVVGSIAATAGSLLIGGVIGYFTAIFLAFYCPKPLKKILVTVINLLAGIPSIVYGFFGIVFLLPILSEFTTKSGDGLLATSIILGIMILPTVVSLSRTSLEAVPRSYYEGSLALGATRSRTVFCVMSPAAKSGITASLILGVGRALGETMAVIMVAGNSVAYPDGLFSSFRVLTANIVLEMGYAGEVQQGALISTGLILLFFVLLINLLFNLFSGKIVRGSVKKSIDKKSADKDRKNPVGGEDVATNQAEKQSVKPRRKKHFPANVNSALSAFGYKIHASEIGKVVAIVSGIISAATLVLVVGFIFVKGLPALISHPSLLFGQYEFGSDNVTLLPSIVATLEVVALSLLISVPIGLFTAVFLNEYVGDNIFVKIIRTSIDVLSGVPSIVYGLFGYITFVPLLGGSSSIIAGVLTISMMLLPVIVRNVEESLKSVPMSLREGSYALGAGKLRTIFKTVLPSALPGILSAIILSMGRVVSESAPFIWTMGSTLKGMPKNLMSSGTTLAVALYNLSGEGLHQEEAYATAFVLIVIVLGLNLLAELIANKFKKKLGGSQNG